MVTEVVFILETDATPGRPNEDFVVATADTAIVVDGAGVPLGGCHHGVAWYARQLGLRTLGSLVSDPGRTLQDGLAEGIRHVASLHSETCDLSNPGTPCAAVAILRIGTETVEALTLAGTSVVLETGDDLHVLCDLAIESAASPEPVALAGLRFGTVEHETALAELVRRQTATRNRPGGWWVAASEPDAAYHALTFRLPLGDARRMAVFSDGAARPVDQMGVNTWWEYLDLLDKATPAGLIGQVRMLEHADPDGERFPRTKWHDDASVAHYVKS